MKEFLYYPIIKTRDSELRCFKNIEEERLDKILPIYELTKSRRTKLAPDGDIHRRMKEVESIQGTRPFILDLTTEDRYLNPQIRVLLDDEDGFSEWRYFVFNIYRSLNIIPMIHLYGDDSYAQVNTFVNEASKLSWERKLALRLPIDLEKLELQTCLKNITSALEEGAKLYLIFDIGNCGKDWHQAKDLVIQSWQEIEQFNRYIEEVIVASTSFPKNVAQEGKDDESGTFLIYEEELYQGIAKSLPFVKYGDYASINIDQIEIRASTFVPRIDIVSADCREFSYKRYRRTEGGYIKCAEQTLSNSTMYENLNTWADEEIALASQGNPTGISPSYWISVRMRYYIERILQLRERDKLSREL